MCVCARTRVNSYIRVKIDGGLGGFDPPKKKLVTLEA